MSSTSTGRPSILANLILMLLVGGMLFGFFFLLRRCEEKAGNARVIPVELEKKDSNAVVATQPTKEEIAKTVAEANQIRKGQPVGRDEEEAARNRKLLEASNTGGRPFSTPAASVTANATTGTMVPTADPMPPTPPPTALPVDDNSPAGIVQDTGDVLPPKEPMREVAPISPEGSALIKDATARVDEAPSDLYSDKAKAKVREGLMKARRIFKVHTVYFEKGGAKPGDQDVTELGKSLTAGALVEVMEDPRAVFFVLGFADRSGDAATNKKLSKDRADAVIDLLKTAGTLNLTYPVAIGSSELVAPENANKNRAAEVWLVLP